MWAYLESDNVRVPREEATVYQHPGVVSMESIVCSVFLLYEEMAKEVIGLTNHFFDNDDAIGDKMIWARQLQMLVLHYVLGLFYFGTTLRSYTWETWDGQTGGLALQLYCQMLGYVLNFSQSVDGCPSSEYLRGIGLVILSFTKVHHAMPVDAFVEETQEASLSSLSSMLKMSGHFQGHRGLREAWMMLGKRGGESRNTTASQMRYEFVFRVRSRLRALINEIKGGTLLYTPVIPRQANVNPRANWSAAAMEVPDSLWLPPRKDFIITSVMRSLYTLLSNDAATMREIQGGAVSCGGAQASSSSSSTGPTAGNLTHTVVETLTKMKLMHREPKECSRLYYEEQLQDGARKSAIGIAGIGHAQPSLRVESIFRAEQVRRFTGKKRKIVV
jgi:hypothetical protein